MDQKGNGITFVVKDDLSIDDKRVKSLTTEDDGSVSSTEDSLLNRSLTVDLIVDNIRFTPKVIEFRDAFEGKQFSEKLTVQNIGRNPVLVKVGEPNSFIFQLKKPTLRAKFLASGSSLTKTITYTYHNDDLVQRSQIPIQINGILVEHPIVVKKATPEIEVEPQKLNFEIVNLGAPTKSMTLTIHNSGGKRTKFEIDCGKRLDLVVSPMRGTLKPKQCVTVRVDIIGFCEGEYYGELWIKTTEVPIRVPVLVEVVRPRLEILHPMGTENFTLINFPPAFNGTQRLSTFVLKNVSNDISHFVALVEVEGKLEVLKTAKNLPQPFDMFVVAATEGVLAPFESRICSVLFRPKPKVIKKGWRHINRTKRPNPCDHVVFFSIQSVYYVERRDLAKIEMQTIVNQAVIEKSGLLQKSSRMDYMIGEETQLQTYDNLYEGAGETEERTLRFCLHGRSVEPDILIQPDSLDFGDLTVGQTETRVLRMTNNCEIPVRCKPGKTMNVMMKPQSVWLKSEKAEEFLVSLAPKCAGTFKSTVSVQILAESDTLGGSKTLVQVAVYKVRISYTARHAPSPPAPKVGLGITPLITDEVGLNKDLITFKDASKLPYAAMLDLKKGFKPAWMKAEKDKMNNVDNALIALPNDRSRFGHPWPRDKVCRSIFKGFFRYSPPEDLSYTLSPEGRIVKKERQVIWVESISKMLRQENNPNLKELEYLEYKPPCLNKVGKCHCLIRANQNEKYNELDSLPRHPLVPLTPTYLYAVKVEPKLIDFSMVAVATKVQEKITVNNMNPFPIGVRFILSSPNVSMTENNTMVVEPRGTRTVQIFFRTREFGRYFGFLNYVINGAHEFKITISAFVISKTLFISDKNLALNFKECIPKDLFQPNTLFIPLENVLPSPVQYRLVLADDTAFGTEITQGEVPPRSKILAEVVFKLAPGKSFYSEIAVISEGGHTDLMKFSFPHKRVAVYFLKSEMNMHDIPLNLPTKIKPQILNVSYQDVCFEVLTLTPMPGITIVPSGGIIRARSVFHLDIVVQIPVIMRFSFTVILNVQFSNRISVNVRGNVVCPIIRMQPSELTMRKIYDQSLHTATISATNEGTTLAEVKMDFTTCPEFSVVDGESEFTLLPKQTANIAIRLDANNIARYVFYLPIIINRILGPPMIQDPVTEFVSYYISEAEATYEDYGEVLNSLSARLGIPCVCINCTVIHALIHITPLSLNFPDEYSMKPQNITITNVSEDDVKFCIRTTALGEANEAPFDLTVVTNNRMEITPKCMKVCLRPEEEFILSVTFIPRKYGSKRVDLPLCVSGYNDGHVYNCIHLSGNLKAPQIYPESSEVYFPPLPLGVACDVVLTVFAEHYCKQDTISCVVWDPAEGSDESIQKHLTAKWLKEPNVTERNKRHKFQLLITFQSFVPIGLKCYIILLDSMGGYATVRVTAIADNSALTNHLFLNTKTSIYRLVREATSLPKLLKSDHLSLRHLETKSDLKMRENSDKSRIKMPSKSTVDLASLNQESSDTIYEVGDWPVEHGPE